MPVLMLHGFPLDRRSLAGSLGALVERRGRYRQLRVDLPGFGSSPGVSEIASSDDMVDFVVALVDELIGDQQVLVVGESWVAYLRYGSVWHFGDDLLHPQTLRWLTSGLVHLGFGLVFLGLAQLALSKRDL